MLEKKVIKVNWLNVTRLDSNKLIISSFLFFAKFVFPLKLFCFNVTRIN